VFCKKLDNFKNKPAGVLKIFYDQMPTLPSSDDITRFDGNQQNNKIGNWLKNSGHIGLPQLFVLSANLLATGVDEAGNIGLETAAGA
jgi:hypothetical protein